jgi:hypothetical protein
LHNSPLKAATRQRISAGIGPGMAGPWAAFILYRAGCQSKNGFIPTRVSIHPLIRKKRLLIRYLFAYSLSSRNPDNSLGNFASN